MKFTVSTVVERFTKDDESKHVIFSAWSDANDSMIVAVVFEGRVVSLHVEDERQESNKFYQSKINMFLRDGLQLKSNKLRNFTLDSNDKFLGSIMQFDLYLSEFILRPQDRSAICKALFGEFTQERTTAEAKLQTNTYTTWGDWN